MKLKTLSDVRKLIGHLPADTRKRETWQHVADQLTKAANGGGVDDVVIALRLVLMLERVPVDQWW
jgi:hypothetical protein